MSGTMNPVIQTETINDLYSRLKSIGPAFERRLKNTTPRTAGTASIACQVVTDGILDKMPSNPRTTVRTSAPYTSIMKSRRYVLVSQAVNAFIRRLA